MIEQIIRKYDFSKVQWKTIDAPAVLDPVFAVNFKAVPAELPTGVLFQSPALNLVLENKSEEDYENLLFNRRSQNYFSMKAPDGSCLVLEAHLLMECDYLHWKTGFPIALLQNQEQEHEFTILFDGVSFNIICDGEVMDREMPEGNGVKHEYYDGGHFDCSTPAIRSFGFTNDLSKVQRYEERISRDIPIAYYTPYGFNTWIGDVVTFAHNGLFHIFYLHDRRHHQSRRGKGAHEFWHMTSSDLKNWVDHGPVMELSAQWQSTGTGNAFLYQGKLHLSFGLHTERSKPWKERTDQLFKIHLSEHGNTGEFDYNQIGTLTPGGASYAVSEDGIHFTPSNKLIHYLTNPSIFPAPDGSLFLYQRGKWKSDHPGSWELVDKDFPPSGKNSFTRHCLDCPTFFSLGGWEYFMIGFTGFYGRKAGEEKWIDFTQYGWEPYDGANVPMATEFDGRMIEGSWPAGCGWGSCLLLRELIPLGNGRLGKRWVPETMPKFGEAEAAGGDIELPEERIYSLIEVECNLADGVFSACFSGEDGETPVTFSFDPAKKRAQWSTTPEKQMLTCREKVKEHPEYSRFSQYSDIHFKSRDYARDELIGLEDSFSLKFLICRDPKHNATIIDTEIGGKHTMLTQRNDLHVKHISLSGGAKITFRKG